MVIGAGLLARRFSLRGVFEGDGMALLRVENLLSPKEQQQYLVDKL